jgi:hypothetical protein
MRKHARTRRAAWVVIALSFALTVLVAIPASAATPTMTASLSPGSAFAGAPTPFALSVSSDQGTLQSLTLVAPDGFYVGSATPGSVGTDHRTITVSGLKISGSAVLNVQISAWPACTPNLPNLPYTWNLTARQKGGTEYAALSFSTTVNQPSSCKLVFGTMTDQIKNQNPGATVTVEVQRANGTKDTTYTGTAADHSISLSIEKDPGISGATLAGGGATAPVAGLATFSTSLSQSGYGYVLEACSPTVNGEPCAPLTGDSGTFLSGPFAVYDAQFQCDNNPNHPCTVTAQGQQVSVRVSAGGQLNQLIKAGVWDVPPSGSPNPLANLDCAGYDEVTTQVAAFAYTGSGEKIVVDTISADIMKTLPQNGVAHLETCLGSSVPFTDRFGAPAQPNSIGLYVGLLPDCPNVSPIPTLSVPCVISRTGGGQGTGQISYIADDGDPGGSRH